MTNDELTAGAQAITITIRSISGVQQ
jgi:hypothetical protein